MNLRKKTPVYMLRHLSGETEFTGRVGTPKATLAHTHRVLLS